MSRDSGADQPTQRTVAELLAEYGGSSEKGSRRRRRKPEDPSETAPQEIINRVLSDSGKMRPVNPDEEPPSSRRKAGPSTGQPPAGPANQQPAQPPAAQPPAAQPPAAQQPAAPPPAAPPPAAQAPAAQPQQPPQAAGPASPATPQPASEPPAEPGPQPGSAGYWAQRFSTAGGAASTPSTPSAPSAPSSDAEATVRQPALPPARSMPPIAPAGPPQLPENLTEQLPRIDGGVDQSYPAQAEPDADPYDYDSFGDSGQVFVDEGEYQPSYDESYDQDYDSAAPAGLDDDYDPDEGDRPPSAGKEWGTLALQGVAGLIGGGAVWVGFRWLWINATIAAFGAALVFTGLLVLVAWKFFRTNDLQTILLSVLVGLFCTVSPAALLLINQ